jgi:hypothetical protein
VRKEDTMTLRRVTLVVLTLLLAAWPFLATAQDATPGTASTTPLDLAAMALVPDDVPTGYFDDYSEWWVPAEAFSALVLGGAATPPGLERVYQTFYFNPDEAAAIHTYLYEFASAEEAAAGIAIVDEALRPPLPEGTVIGPTHMPGPDLGDDPRQMTVVTYDTWAAGGPRADVVAASFRRDRLVVGVAIERYTDPPSGTPVGRLATPIAPDPAQEELATRLATTLDERITTVLTGQAPAGVDPALSDVLLPFDQLVDASTPVFGGYKAGSDLLRCGICGEDNSLVRFADEARGGFNRGVLLGPLVDGEPTPPFVSVAVASFTSPEEALAVLEAIRKAPNDLPTSIPVPRGARALATDPHIPGAAATLAFQGAFDEEDPNAPVDSAGVDFVMEDRLVTVDVQGGLSAGDAMAAAVDLATQQAACLASDDPCSSITLPPSLQADALG